MTTCRLLYLSDSSEGTQFFLEFPPTVNQKVSSLPNLLHSWLATQFTTQLARYSIYSTVGSLLNLLYSWLATQFAPEWCELYTPKSQLHKPKSQLPSQFTVQMTLVLGVENIYGGGVYIYIWVYIYVYVYKCMFIYMNMICIGIYLYTCIYTYIYIHICMYINVYIQEYKCIPIHIIFVYKNMNL